MFYEYYITLCMYSFSYVNVQVTIEYDDSIKDAKMTPKRKGLVMSILHENKQ